MWKQSINLILGTWLMISSVLVPLQTSVNLEITGFIVAMMGFLSFKSWQGITNGLLGTWLFVCGVSSALILPLNCIISGAVITLFSGWDLDLQMHNDTVPHKL